MKSFAYQNGFFNLKRSVLSTLFPEGNKVLATWTYVASQAGYDQRQWRDGKRIMLVDKYTFVGSLSTASRGLRMSRETLKKALLTLRRLGLIELEIHKFGFLIRVVKKFLDAAFQLGRSNSSHKELISPHNHINIKKDPYPKKTFPSGQLGVMNANQTREYFKQIESEQKARSIPQITQDFIKNLG